MGKPFCLLAKLRSRYNECILPLSILLTEKKQDEFVPRVAGRRDIVLIHCLTKFVPTTRHNVGSEMIFVLRLGGCVSLITKCQFKITYNVTGWRSADNSDPSSPATEVDYLVKVQLIDFCR